MKLCTILLIGLVTAGAAISVALAEKKGPPPGWELLSSRTNVLPVAFVKQPGLRGYTWLLTNSAAWKSNRWASSGQPRLFAFRGSNTPASPPPGVYESKPYTGIVVVPGPQWDDRCLFPGPDVTPPMPTGKPELRLVPRKK
jgi:hypothetical protein